MPAPLERVGRPDRLPLLPERAEQPADDLALPVESDQPLLEGPGEPQVAVDLEQLAARSSPAGIGGRLGGRTGTVRDGMT